MVGVEAQRVKSEIEYQLPKRVVTLEMSDDEAEEALIRVQELSCSRVCNLECSTGRTRRGEKDK